jgi:hypothetical protein
MISLHGRIKWEGDDMPAPDQLLLAGSFLLVIAYILKLLH